MYRSLTGQSEPGTLQMAFTHVLVLVQNAGSQRNSDVGQMLGQSALVVQDITTVGAAKSRTKEIRAMGRMTGCCLRWTSVSISRIERLLNLSSCPYLVNSAIECDVSVLLGSMVLLLGMLHVA